MRVSIPQMQRKIPTSNDKRYIVKDDFIIKLKEVRPKRSRTVKTQSMQTEVGMSSVMVSRKKQILEKMKVNSMNDFYDLNRQIEANQQNLYRKMNIVLRKMRVDCNIRMQNPFVAKKEERASFNQERQLSKLIYNVQPYWIKRSFLKSQNKAD